MFFFQQGFARGMSLCAALCLILTGCVDISDRTIDRQPAEVSIKETEEEAYFEPAVTTETFTEEEIYKTYTLSEENRELLSYMVFVGDSICMGLSHYGVLGAEQVLAQGSVAARNIYDFEFQVGDGKAGLLTALVNAQPAIVVLSLGMNDINMSTTEDFSANYKKLINTIKNYLPLVKIIALSITPVNSASEFTDNSAIDEYNAALKSTVNAMQSYDICYVDVGVELKNAEGELKSLYGAGDGLHLTEEAYHAILWQVCNNARWGEYD